MIAIQKGNYRHLAQVAGNIAAVSLAACQLAVIVVMLWEGVL